MESAAPFPPALVPPLFLQPETRAVVVAAYRADQSPSFSIFPWHVLRCYPRLIGYLGGGFRPLLGKRFSNICNQKYNEMFSFNVFFFLSEAWVDMEGFHGQEARGFLIEANGENWGGKQK